MATGDDSFIEIINDACDELGIDRPSQLVGASDLGDRQKCALGQGCATLISHEPDTGWEVLQKLHQFSSVLGTSEYDLPTDYDRLTIDTVWDRSQLTPMMGPLSPALWQTIKSGLIGNGIYFSRYRVVRSQATSIPKKVFILDPPSTTNGADLVYEYQSTGMTALADLSATNSQFQNDTDLFLLPRDLLKLSFKWRWRMAQELAYTTFLEEYNQELDKYSGRDRPEPGFSMSGGRYRQNFLGWGNIPDTGYDT